MTADRTTAPRTATRRRIVVSAALLPLLALAACGYGSQKKDDTSHAAASSGTGTDAGKKLSASTVKIGYFANLTHATPLVGLKEGFFAQELGSGTTIKESVFNAGPAEIEALNAGSIDIGWIGPSPPSTAGASRAARA